MNEVIDQPVAVRPGETLPVDGIVVESMKFCDLWGVESGALVQALRDRQEEMDKTERQPGRIYPDALNPSVSN